MDTVRTDVLRARLEGLETEIIQQDICDVLATLRYPVLRLPPEITSEIFVSSLPQHFEFFADPDNVPLVLTRICRAWRTIALSTPRLWNSVCLMFGSGDEDRDMKRISMLENWLSRATNQPLFMRLISLNSDGPPMESEKKLAAILARHSQQWRDVILNLPFHQLPSFRSSASFPQLQRLGISMSQNTGAVDLLPIAVWRDVPALCHVSLLDGFLPSDVALPWRQLLDILSHVTLPALRVLNLDEVYFKPHQFSPLFIFLSRSQCQLSDLSIRFGDLSSFPTSKAMQLFDRLPSLRSLTLGRANTYNSLAVFQNLRHASFIPRLESLVVTEYWNSDTEKPRDYGKTTHAMFDHLADALSMRWNSPNAELSQLARFILKSNYTLKESPSAEIIRRLELLSTQGMELCIRTGTQSWI
ncbi:hypothetical protein B0H10DRAFT_1999886 [Mycena sp. CBHHK59/15]|nr:hypothetical protein B0H10DRAFT_1999886 [Mycena sp. CBHHK59/15]